MGRKIPFKVLECKRCGYKWCPRTEEPVSCPSCRSPYWTIVKRGEIGGRTSNERD